MAMTMRYVLSLLLSLGLIEAAVARDSAAVTPRQLIANPAKYKGEMVVVRRIRCVDPGGAGFVCEAAADASRLRLDASVLGAATKLAIAEKLVETCKGRPALTNPECTFDAVLEPTGHGMDAGATVIYAREIDMFSPRRP